MLSVVRALAGSRSARPLLVWALAVFVYVVFDLPQGWVLLLIVGLGVALAVTVSRVREARDQLGDRAGRAWSLAERLTGAVEDRIRGGQNARGRVGAAEPDDDNYYDDDDVIEDEEDMYGQVRAASGPVYDPGALLSAVVAVLAAEGLPAEAGPALPAVGQLLADLGVQCRPGVPASTALGLMQALSPGAPRRARVMPAALLASVIRVVLTQDRVLPEHITTDTAHVLITDSAEVLTALRVSPGDAGSLAEWPVVAEIVDALPLPVPFETETTDPHGYDPEWGAWQ